VRRAGKIAGARGTVLAMQADQRDRWRRYAGYLASAERLRPEGLPALTELRWLQEEYAVSVFAQELKTAVPVSAKRLAEAEHAVRRTLGL
jgi:ATP-dependent helicase HrpA